MSLNLNQTTDLHYRYKMPKLEAKVESRGNGIKTLVPNLVKVSTAIFRPPEYTIRFLAMEVGCSLKVEKRDNRYILNGAHTAERLQDVLYSFIRRFVLCGACDNPETRIEVTSNAAEMSCTACGAVTKLDAKHKLVQFMVKNPPSDEFNPSTYKKEVANESDSDDAPVAEKLSAEEVKREESALAAKLKLIASQAETREQKLAKFAAALRPHVTAANAAPKGDISPDTVNSLLNYSQQLEVRAFVSLVIAKHILDPKSALANSTSLTAALSPGRGALIRKFTLNHRPSQVNFLVGVEEALCAKGAARHWDLRSLPKLFAFLYNKDLVETEAFAQWHAGFATFVASELAKCDSHDAQIAGQLLAIAGAFLQQIQEASDDDSSDESETDEKKAPELTAQDDTQNLAEKLKATQIANDDDDDLDIDDI